MIHVLVVDDEPGLLESGKKYLEESGDISADTALSAHAALEMLGHELYDAIVSDFQLPDMDGFLFLKEIQVLIPGLPSIFLSHESTPGAPERAGGGKNSSGRTRSGKSIGQFAGLHQRVHDVVTRIRTQENFLEVAGNSREGMLLVQNGIIIFSNPLIRTILGGYSSAEIEGCRVTDFIHAEDREKVQNRIEKLLDGKKPEPEMTFRAVGRNGQFRHLLTREIVIAWNGKPAVLSYLNDISELSVAESALVLVNRKMNILNELTRHDIANRLTVLRARLKRVRNSVRDPLIIRQLDDVETAGKEIFNHLEVARMYQELGIGSPRWFDMSTIPDSGRIRSEMPDLNLFIEIGDLEIYADPLFPRVFENLIDNSLRHGNNVSMIRITAREAGNGLVITFEDNGSGIPEVDKERIFEQGVGKHTGLGLFLSREILSITGISIRETGMAGSGACFEIAVPRRAYRIKIPRCTMGSPCA